MTTGTSTKCSPVLPCSEMIAGPTQVQPAGAPSFGGTCLVQREAKGQLFQLFGLGDQDGGRQPLASVVCPTSIM
jgi:hypothetical protein